MISKIIQPHIDKIKRVHTDGFLSNSPLKFQKINNSLDSVNIGDNIGELSYKGYYEKCRVENAMRVVDERGNKIEKWIKD